MTPKCRLRGRSTRPSDATPTVRYVADRDAETKTYEAAIYGVGAATSNTTDVSAATPLAAPDGNVDRDVDHDRRACRHAETESIATPTAASPFRACGGPEVPRR